jgi:alcohol dehydrogenase class IV
VIEPFTWQDGERVVRFGRGTLAGAGELLGDGYALLTTPRTRAAAPEVVAAAASVHEVAPGLVDELSAALIDEVPQDAGLLVALGGGRVIDTAKAIAAGRGGSVRVAAIPTTLSAAEMTRVHRLPAGREEGSRHVRPAIVLNDPALSASQPLPELAASAANSLGHAAEGAVTDRASVVPRLAAAEAALLTAAAYEQPDDPDRDALALAALLSGYTIDSTHYGLHHVLSQTLVRVGGLGHGPANAAMLPHTAAALERRAGPPALPGIVPLARLLARRAGAERLSALGLERGALERCADAAAKRPDLARTPPVADRDELLALYEAAW